MKSDPRKLFPARHIFAWLIRVLTGVRLTFDPGGPKQKRIYFANHSSHLDFAVIWAALPARLREQTRPVAAADYWDKGKIRKSLAQKVFRAIFIARGKATRHNNPIEMLAEILDEGDDLIIFPEGTRSLDGSVTEFKSGLDALARLRPDAILVPVYLENLNRILPKGDFLIVPLIGGATFGPPCEGPIEGETKREFLSRARSALLALAANHDDEESIKS